MAVVPMQKVCLLVHGSAVDAVLDVVQQADALEFQPIKERTPVPETVQFPHASLLPRIQHAAAFLEPYAPKVGLWTQLREGTRTMLTEAEVASRYTDVDAAAQVVEEVESLQVESANVNEEIRSLTERREALVPWRSLSVPLTALNTNRTNTYLVAARHEVADLAAALTAALGDPLLPVTITAVEADAVAVTFYNDAATSAAVEAAVSACDAVVVETPAGTGTPAEELSALETALTAATDRHAWLHDQAEHSAKLHLNRLWVAGEVLTWQHDRFATLSHAAGTQYTVRFEGWLNQNKRASIEAAFAEKNLPAVFSNIEPAEGEEPPVDIENSPLVQPFEVVTRLYGMPGHKDLDPTLFLAGFFFLFFGLSLTDVGYGIVLMAVSAIILTLLKVPPVMRTFAKLLLFMGLGSFLVGLLFGGYLGVDPSLLPAPLQALQIFDPIGDPLPVFYLALGLGVVQVMAGMLLKIYSESRQGRLLDGVLDQGPWLLMFCLGILYLGVTLEYVSGLTVDQVINLMYVGVALIVIASGRNGKGILGKVQASATALYDSIGYFSDILSYSRLLALGLATTALAFAVNLIAGIVSDSVPYLGPVLAVVILVIGHLFTLAVNTLGAFIHSARLQFVEFFGKFIDGTGRQFTPLSRTEKYISIRDD